MPYRVSLPPGARNKRCHPHVEPNLVSPSDRQLSGVLDWSPNTHGFPRSELMKAPATTVRRDVNPFRTSRRQTEQDLHVGRSSEVPSSDAPSTRRDRGRCSPSKERRTVHEVSQKRIQ